VELTLYQLPEVMKAKDVYVVEGEKCADALNKAFKDAGVDAVATTNPMGAGKWRHSYSKSLKSKHLSVLPDNDDPGEGHTATICASTYPVAGRLKLVRLPGLSSKGDVADWLQQGGTVEELQSIVETTEQWEPSAPSDDEDARGYVRATLDGTSERVTLKNISREFAATDYGNAERLVHRHGDDIRFCHTAKRWMIWAGSRWTMDVTSEVERRAKETVRSIYEEVAKTTDDVKRRPLADHARKSEAAPSIKRMMALAQSEPGVAITPDQLDRNPMLLNCNNGTLNLETGKLEPHNRAPLITKLVPVNYDPNAKCPTFRRFLIRIMGGNRRLIRFLQRAIGYALTGRTDEQVFFILYGTGSNGKSTLLEVLRALLNDYAQQAPAEMLMARSSSGGANNEVARLQGVRLVSAMETEEGKRLALSMIKQLTGGDTVTARFLFGEYFEFTPHFKIMLTTNHKPHIPEDTEAIWRRVRLLPFNVTISESQRDRSLPTKLRAELPGILTWAVAGCLHWQRNGLGVPDEVQAAIQDYRDEMDDLGHFLSDCCERDPRAETQSAVLYGAYQDWCSRNSEAVITMKMLASRLIEKGFSKTRKRGGVHWHGIRVLG